MVNVNGDPAILRSGSLEALSGRYLYEYTYNITSADKQGIATISIEAVDLAGNKTRLTNNVLLNIDTIYPVVSRVEVLPALAKAGTITISFALSETPLIDPLVRVNGSQAVKKFKNNRSYIYTYQVTDADEQGAAELYIEVKDAALNVTPNTLNNLLAVDTIAPARPAGERVAGKNK